MDGLKGEENGSTGDAFFYRFEFIPRMRCFLRLKMTSICHCAVVSAVILKSLSLIEMLGMGAVLVHTKNTTINTS